MILFDTETTGLIASDALPLDKQPRIIELFALVLDDDTMEERGHLHFFAKPPFSVAPPSRLTDADLADARPFSAHFRALSDFFLGQRIAVAHNCAYDMGMLALEMQRLDKVTQFPWPPRRFCTVEDTVDLSPSGKFLKLGDLYQLFFGESFDDAHRAEADTRALARIARELRRMGRL